MRLNRVLTMLGLAVAAGIGLIWTEGTNLRLKQKITELSYLEERLVEDQARLRLAIGHLAAPAQLLEAVKQSDLPLEEPQLPIAKEPRRDVPLHLHR